MSILVDKLTIFKGRLLDLSARNRMLNSNFQARTSSHFRIIDELPDQLYEKLLKGSMSFKSLPNMASEPSDEKQTRFKKALDEKLLLDEEYLEEIRIIEEDPPDDINQANETALRKLKDKVRAELDMSPRNKETISLAQHAKNHGLNPNFDLPLLEKGQETQGKWSDRRIQTLMLSDTQNRFLRNINRNYKSSLKETGVNPLFFCFGFLQWKEAKSSDKVFYSPLLMLQVDLFEKKRGTGLRTSGIGDSILINQTLNERLKKDFKYELPEVEETEDEEDSFSIDDYLKEVQDKVATPNNWKVRRWVSFGVYRAHNIAIFKDIEKIEQSEPSNLLKELLEGKESSSSNSSEIYEVDDKKYQQLIPALVREADASQFSAIIDALNGENLVIKGPPGTGKSQTITNIIATLIAKGKRVLFVAQKQAALDVVRNNLEAAGLSKYLLEIFSIKANKKSIMESIRDRTEMKDPSKPFDFNNTILQLNKTKGKLNEYATLIGSKFGDTGLTIHEILWDVPELDYEIPQELHLIDPDDSQTISESSFKKLTADLAFLRETYYSIFDKDVLFNNPIRKIRKRITDLFQIKKIKKEFLGIHIELKKFLEREKKLFNTNKALFDISSEDFKSNTLIKKWVDADQNSKDEKKSQWEVLKIILNPKSSSKVEEYINLKDQLDKDEIDAKNSNKKIKSIFDFDNSLYDLKEIQSAAKLLIETNLFSFLSKDWWKANSIFNQLYCGTDEPEGVGVGFGKGKLLEELFKYISTKDSNDENISNKKVKIKDLERKICKVNDLSSLEALNFFSIQDIHDLIIQSKLINDSFRKGWISKPDSIIEFNQFVDEKSELISKVEKLLNLLEVDIDSILADDKSTIQSLENFFKSINNNAIDFRDYMNWLSAENNIEEDTVKTFYEAYSNSSLNMSDIDKVFKYVVRTSQQRKIQEEYSDILSTYSPKYLTKLRRDLKSLDTEVMRSYKERISFEIFSHGSMAPPGQSKGRVSGKTEMGLINHVSKTTSTRTSIREFMKRSFAATTTIKPCTLMSPLSVSQIMPLEQIFDVIVIDEASQMKPEYSIGSIARAKQAIIVGDPNQLPPTSFGQAAIDEDTFDEDYGDESILDMAYTVLHPPRELLWHYRSRHEDLIKFSNYEFYKNLMIPVTADNNQTNRGIKHVYLDNGRYIVGSQENAGGVNIVEADAIVSKVVKFMKERPNESIGVATMNIKQMKLIDNKFRQAANRDHQVMKYLSDWIEKDNGLYEFFVKNLENVQGDERDVIFISTVYGPHNDKDPVYQRFGPITGIHGWRRLNVLFTRAKNQLFLFTSLQPSDIKVKETSSRGVKVFQKYLAFAETKMLQEGESTLREVPTVFQQWAIDQINSIPGFSADWEIGVRGYFIDIGVKHENYPYGYLLGVETDGATYHSTSSARDRDFLRQTILEGYGWVFHRIWSTDWIQDPIGVKAKLKSVLEHRLNEVLEALEKKKNIEDQPSTNVPDTLEDLNSEAFIQDSYYSVPYITAELSEYMEVDPGLFKQAIYKPELQEGIKQLVEKEGPISYELIVERVKTSHGWKKAGRIIRSVISKSIPQRIIKTEFNGEEFYWPEDVAPETWVKARYPNVDVIESKRKIHEISPEEIFSIAEVVKNKSVSKLFKSQLAKEVVYFLYWSKCTAKMEEYILESLEYIERNKEHAEDFDINN